MKIRKRGAGVCRIIAERAEDVRRKLIVVGASVQRGHSKGEACDLVKLDSWIEERRC